MYQLMFAIITPALIIGAIAERMKFSAIMRVHDAVDVPRLFPASPHDLGHDGMMNGVWQSPAPRSPPSISPAARSCT